MRAPFFLFKDTIDPRQAKPSTRRTLEFLQGLEIGCIGNRVAQHKITKS